MTASGIIFMYMIIMFNIQNFFIKNKLKPLLKSYVPLNYFCRMYMRTALQLQVMGLQFFMHLMKSV